MLSPSQDTLLEVSNTTSPEKLFAYDCVTLYDKNTHFFGNLFITIFLYKCAHIAERIMDYSVTQSYANSFLGDVVLDTSNNVSRDESNVLDQI